LLLTCTTRVFADRDPAWSRTLPRGIQAREEEACGRAVREGSRRVHQVVRLSRRARHVDGGAEEVSGAPSAANGLDSDRAARIEPHGNVRRAGCDCRDVAPNP
jgi:hypothetical protein